MVSKRLPLCSSSQHNQALKPTFSSLESQGSLPLPPAPLTRGMGEPPPGPPALAPWHSPGPCTSNPREDSKGVRRQGGGRQITWGTFAPHLCTQECADRAATPSCHWRSCELLMIKEIDEKDLQKRPISLLPLTEAQDV